MKPSIHPEYTHQTKVSCVCGNTFVTGSTLKEIRVEICSNCHPFYTGKQKLIDTAGRVDRFKRILERKAAVVNAKTAKKSTAKKTKKTES